MKRIVFSTAIVTLLGIAASAHIAFLTAHPFFLAVFLVLATATVLLNAYITHFRMWPVLLAVLILAMGYFSLRVFIHCRTLYGFYEKPSYVQGYITEVNEGENSNVTLTVKTEKIICGERVFTKPCKIAIYTAKIPDIAYGKKIAASNVLLKPAVSQYGNADCGDYYLMSKGIHATAYVNAEKITAEGYADISWFAKGCARLKSSLSGSFARYLDSDSAALANGVLSGNTDGMSEELTDNFRKCGLSHITAVSGFNLTLIATVISGFFAAIKLKNSLLSKAVSLIFIWLFTFFTGASLSVVRAAIMITIFIISEIVMRQNDRLTSLGYAVLIMLLINPASLFDVGFQLSCAATLTILMFCEPISGLFQSSVPLFLRETCSVTLAAQIGVYPILAYHFNSIPLLGLAANLIIVPLVPYITAGGILLWITSSIPSVACLISYMLKVMCGFTFFVVNHVAAIPYASLSCPTPSPVFLMIYIFAAITIYFALTNNAAHIHAFSLITLVLVLTYWVMSYDPSASVTFLNVGNADCALLRSERCTIMVDSGGSSRYDIGRKKVIPYLRQHGIGKIDAALITHYHIDHVDAYLSLLEEGLINTIFLPEGIYSPPIMAELEAAAKASGCEVRHIFANTQITLDKFKIKVIGDAESCRDENASLMYMAHYGDISVLFSGDVEADAEKRICGIYDIDCDILKVPHHGSDTSSSAQFIKSTSPEYAVISTGRNSYGHPSPDIVSNLKREVPNVYRTDKCGTITIKFNCNRILSTAFAR